VHGPAVTLVNDGVAIATDAPAAPCEHGPWLAISAPRLLVAAGFERPL
jgi:hypothetical protein